jgi:hypothetical protein
LSRARKVVNEEKKVVMAILRWRGEIVSGKRVVVVVCFGGKVDRQDREACMFRTLCLPTHVVRGRRDWTAREWEVGSLCLRFEIWWWGVVLQVQR